MSTQWHSRKQRNTRVQMTRRTKHVASAVEAVCAANFMGLDSRQGLIAPAGICISPTINTEGAAGYRLPGAIRYLFVGGVWNEYMQHGKSRTLRTLQPREVTYALQCPHMRPGAYPHLHALRVPSNALTCVLEHTLTCMPFVCPHLYALRVPSLTYLSIQEFREGTHALQALTHALEHVGVKSTWSTPSLTHLEYTPPVTHPQHALIHVPERACSPERQCPPTPPLTHLEHALAHIPSQSSHTCTWRAC
eukprot:1159739-Pelagomonas_calceolata.AAC.2